MENVKKSLSFPSPPTWIASTDVFLQAFKRAKRGQVAAGRRRPGGLAEVQTHNARMLLANVSRWATREALLGAFGDERKIRRVRSSSDVWFKALDSAEWISGDPNWVLEGHGRMTPMEEHLAQQRQFLDSIVIPEILKQRERPYYLGDRFLLRFAEESVPLALQRFDPKRHATGQSVYDLLIECLREAPPRRLQPHHEVVNFSRTLPAVSVASCCVDEFVDSLHNTL